MIEGWLFANLFLAALIGTVVLSASAVVGPGSANDRRDLARMKLALIFLWPLAAPIAAGVLCVAIMRTVRLALVEADLPKLLPTRSVSMPEAGGLSEPEHAGGELSVGRVRASLDEAES